VPFFFYLPELNSSKFILRGILAGFIKLNELTTQKQNRHLKKRGA
jgi:hypothetical protein